jgi:hypothetical protein
MRAADPNIERSETFWKRALDLIPAGTQTLSKGPTQYVRGIAPIYLQRGKGCHVWDVDGNEYIDFTMGLLPVILGYGHGRCAIGPCMHEPGSCDLLRLSRVAGLVYWYDHPWEGCASGRSGSDGYVPIQ